MPDEESISDPIIDDTESTSASIAETKAATSPSCKHGYHRIADIMADYPAAAIFKQFGHLNALNLLYYQAELAQLEKGLQIISEQDGESPDEYRQRYFQSHLYLSQRKTEPGASDSDYMDQWDIMCRIREVLKEYNEAIISQYTIRQMPRPTKKTLRSVLSWMSPDHPEECTLLLGADRRVWQDTPIRDLVALYARAYEDPISTWITENALFWYNKTLGHRFPKRDLSETPFAASSVYSRKPVIRFVTFFAIIIASLMPILSIVILKAIQGTNLRLGVMAVFTFVFCGIFGLFTGPKKTELLAASAAFAAVQVVFISGDDCRNQSSGNSLWMC